jgi:hypothetical protein
MPDNSAIEWTEATWNPVTGCEEVSPGCAHCYAETFAERWRGIPGHPYEQGFALKLWPERLGQPSNSIAGPCSGPRGTSYPIVHRRSQIGRGSCSSGARSCTRRVLKMLSYGSYDVIAS